MRNEEEFSDDEESFDNCRRRDKGTRNWGDKGARNWESRGDRNWVDNNLGNIKKKIPHSKIRMILKLTWNGRRRWSWYLIVINILRKRR